MSSITDLNLAEESSSRVLRRAVAFAWPFRRSLALLLLCSLVQAIPVAVIPILTREILDIALPRHDLSLLLGLGATTGFVAIVGGIGGIAATNLAHATGQRAIHRLRCDMFEILQRMPIDFYGRVRNAELQTRLIQDVNATGTALTVMISSTAQNGLALIAAATALLFLDWRLALVAGVLVGGLTILGRGDGKLRQKLTHARQNEVVKLSGVVDESMTASAVVVTRTLGRQESQRARFGKQSDSLATREIRLAQVGKWKDAIRDGGLILLPTAVYVAAGIIAANGAALSLGTMVAVATIIVRMIRPVAALQLAGQALSGSLALFHRVLAVLDLTTIPVNKDAPSLVITNGSVELVDATVHYTGAAEPSLKCLTHNFQGGTTTAVVGASGAGKSTLVSVLLGLVQPTHGTVSVDGQLLNSVSAVSVVSAIGAVTQHTHLFDASIRDNLKLAAPTADDSALLEACEAAQLSELIERLPDGLSTEVGEQGFVLSGGERQRLSWARLFLRSPSIVVLDEAFSALDPITSARINKAYRKRFRGITTIQISHVVEARDWVEQVVVMEDGRLVQRGSHEELLNEDGPYRELATNSGGLL
ncbi:ABC transporter ATP-binding protein [Mycobacterium sp. pW049]|uniref:ABC transporter ATP-binding protein n=1 Tax=[Mycobacterium] bulgaricum TaxID=3238985 RepID=UPI00351AEFF9